MTSGDSTDFPERLHSKCTRYLELVKRLYELAHTNTQLLATVPDGDTLENAQAREQLLSARNVMKSFASKEQVKIELPPPPQFHFQPSSTYTASPVAPRALMMQRRTPKCDGGTVGGIFEQRLVARLVFLIWRATQVQKQIGLNRLSKRVTRQSGGAGASLKIQSIREERKTEEMRVRAAWAAAREQDAVDYSSNASGHISRLHQTDDRFQKILRELDAHFQAREYHVVEEAKVQETSERILRGVECLERFRKLRKVRSKLETDESTTAEDLAGLRPSVPLFLDFNEIPQAVRNIEESKQLFVNVFKSFERLNSEVSRPVFAKTSIVIRQRSRMYVLASVFRSVQDRLKISALRSLELPSRGPRASQSKYVKAVDDLHVQTTTSLVQQGTAEKHVSVLIRRAPSAVASSRVSEETPRQSLVEPDTRPQSRAFSFWKSIVDE